jgi:hypothetical protein
MDKDDDEGQLKGETECDRDDVLPLFPFMALM